MKGQLVGLALVGVITVAGCGSADKPTATKTAPESSIPSATPTPVETATCTATVTPLMDLFDVMRTEASGSGMDLSALTARFNKLMAAEDSVQSACTNAVYSPYSQAVYELALVNAMASTCDTAADCEKAGVPKHMEKALAQQDAIKTALSATTGAAQ